MCVCVFVYAPMHVCSTADAMRKASVLWTMTLVVKSRFASWQTSICQRPSLFSTLPGTFMCSHTHTDIYIILSTVFWQILCILGMSVLKKFASQPRIHNVLCAFLQAGGGKKKQKKTKQKNKQKNTTKKNPPTKKNPNHQWEELQMIQLNWYCEQQNWEQMQFGSCSCDLIISYLPVPSPFLEFKNNYDIIANLEIPRYAVNTLCLIEGFFPLFRNGSLLKMHTHKGEEKKKQTT